MSASTAAPSIGVALVHGGGLGPWVWHRVLPHLELRSVALERIPAGVDRRKLSLSDCSDFMVQQLAGSGIGQALVVAHSIGGVLALELARRHPELVAGIVFVAANIPRHGENALRAFPLPQRLQMAVGQRLADYNLSPKGAMRDWVRRTLCHDLDPEATRLMLEDGITPEPSALFFEAVRHENLAGIPCTYVELLRDRALPPVIQEEMASRVDARLTTIDCGHTAMLAEPATLAAMIGRAAESAVRLRESAV